MATRAFAARADFACLVLARDVDRQFSRPTGSVSIAA
jgi:hypothetical protein